MSGNPEEDSTEWLINRHTETEHASQVADRRKSNTSIFIRNHGNYCKSVWDKTTTYKFEMI